MDSDAIMAKAVKDAGFVEIPCISHIIQLVLMDALGIENQRCLS